MKTILFTGSHRLLLAEEIFKQYGRNHFDNLSYYFYIQELNQKGFSYWTWELPTVIAKTHTELTSIETINEKEYLKILSLLSIGLDIYEAFEMTFNIGE